ncbi:MAG: TSUP family transporter [Parashewanella sp.]
MEIFILLLLIIAIGTYFQTVTGFGLGIIVTGLATAFNLAELAFIAAVVSLVTLVNCLVAIPKSIKQIDWKIVIYSGLLIIPGVVLGVSLLSLLSDVATHLLQALLGIMIIISGLSSVKNVDASANKKQSSLFSFSISGMLSGFTGGLFGMAGPPLVFHFYRQPFNIATIRSMLLCLFACTSAARTSYVMYQGQLTQEILLLSTLALPLVSLTTVLAAKFPPPINTATMKKIVFAILMLLGGYLLIKSAIFLML